MKQIVINFHTAIENIYRTIAELNVRIGYLPIITFNSAIEGLRAITI